MQGRLRFASAIPAWEDYYVCSFCTRRMAKNRLDGCTFCTGLCTFCTRQGLDGCTFCTGSVHFLHPSISFERLLFERLRRPPGHEFLARRSARHLELGQLVGMGSPGSGARLIVEPALAGDLEKAALEQLVACRGGVL